MIINKKKKINKRINKYKYGKFATYISIKLLLCVFHGVNGGINRSSSSSSSGINSSYMCVV